jgi:mannitol operon transcriptional antiterminator
MSAEAGRLSREESNMTLSMRSRALLKKIMYAGGPLRIKELAGEFQVSERTIKYDLDTIRFWLEGQQVELQSKSSKGIWIVCDDAARIQLLEKLDEAGEHIFLNQHDRVKRLILDLLLQVASLPIGELAKKNDVSRNTILSDLTIAEHYFQDWDLVLERTRQGVQIVASEKQRRLVLENVVQDLLDGSDIFQILQGVQNGEKPRIHFSRILERFLRPLEEVDKLFRLIGSLIRATEREMNVSLTDQAIIGIFIRLCIVIRRHDQETTLAASVPSPQESGNHWKIYQVFRSVFLSFPESLGVTVSDDEAWYICLQAIGMLSLTPDREHFSGQQFPDAFSLTKRLIEQVSIGMRMNFQEDPELMHNLLSHIADKLTKYSYGVVEANPLLNEIIRSYRTMFGQVKRACQEVFGPYGIVLTDPDIGFIVLHFQSSYEFNLDKHKFKALVVCGTGRGTSRLLKTIVENEIKGLQITAFCSVMELDKVLSADSYDLVISIFPIRANLPVVVVKPIPGKLDFQTIQAQVDRLGKTRVQASDEEVKKSHALTDSRVPMEHKFQDIIFKGYEVSKAILAKFGDNLSEERMEGLTLHLLFMMNRVAFSSQFQFDESSAQWESETDTANKNELIELLNSKQIILTDSEIKAILRYLQ